MGNIYLEGYTNKTKYNQFIKNRIVSTKQLQNKYFNNKNNLLINDQKDQGQLIKLHKVQVEMLQPETKIHNLILIIF